MLAVRDVNQYYRQSHILRELTLSAARGECTCLMGRNGVGKTTLLKCVMGLLPIRGGRIEFGDVDITRLAPDARARLGIGYVPQGREIFPQLTVEENLRVALGARADRARRVPALIHDLFPVLAEMRNRRGGDLSGGQQQQLAIARALVLDPKLLLLDEPGEGIQPNIVRQIGAVIKRLNEELNMSVLLVEQKLPFARRTADRFFIMERGAIVAQGPIAALDDATVQRYLSV